MLRRVADGEGFQAPEAALSQIARAAKGSFRDAVSMLDQLAAATGGELTVQSVLQLLGAVDEESLFQLCDLVIDHDTAGALTFVEQLSEQGQDVGRLVNDLLQHLRHLLLVQHLGAVPETLPATEETREKLLAQANQLPEASVLRLCDLLALAVDDMRQGGDPRLPLELALVKVTRPGADLSQESLAYRLELLEQRGHAPAGRRRCEPCRRDSPCNRSVTRAARSRRSRGARAAPARRAPRRAAVARVRAAAGGLERSVLPAVQERVDPDRVRASRGAAGGARGGRADARVPGRGRVPPAPRRGSEERDRAARGALPGDGPQARRRVRARREARARGAEETVPPSEDDLVALFKETFDAREVDE